MISFDDAIARVQAAARPLAPDDVALSEAHGRTLAVPIVATRDGPLWDVSTMDGYAVPDGDGPFRVVGQSLPARPAGIGLTPGTCVRIFTGAPTPPSTARVVPQEVVAREGDDLHLREPSPDRFIRARASDFARGDTLLEAGTLLGPRALVAAAAADCDRTIVTRRPRLRLLATGDEVVAPGTARDRPGANPDSTSLAVLALARDWGAEPIGTARAVDDLESLLRSAPALLDGADIFVVTGGASVGDRDFGKAMFGDALALIFSTVRIKPGKPVWLGRAGETFVLGLPGNPTSALVTARLFLVPLLAALLGRAPADALGWERLPLAEPLGAPGSRETFSRARLDEGQLHLLPNQDSGSQHMLAQAEWLVRRPIGDTNLAAGTAVQALRF